MTDVPKPQARTRVTRPDQATAEEQQPVASPTGGEFEGDRTEDDDATEGHVPLEAGRGELAETAPNFEAPFAARGTQVLDNAGRVVCFVGSAHLTAEARETTAGWLVRALNHFAGQPNKG
jgi:hypothetical protein